MVIASKVAALVLIALGEVGCASGSSKVDQISNVGYAEISADGVLTLNLIGKTDDGIIAHGFKQYRPGDPDYESVKKHIGDIKPGEKRPIAPFE